MVRAFKGKREPRAKALFGKIVVPGKARTS